LVNETDICKHVYVRMRIFLVEELRVTNRNKLHN